MKRGKKAGWTDITDTELQSACSQATFDEAEQLRQAEVAQISRDGGKWLMEGSIDLKKLRFPDRTKPEIDM